MRSNRLKRLWFEYKTALRFGDEVTSHCFSLRCLPVSDNRQLICEPQCIISPDGRGVWFSRDSFGNSVLCGRISEGHDSFSFNVKGTAQVKRDYRIPGGAAAIYGYESPMTRIGDKLTGFYNELAPILSGDPLQRALIISDRLYGYMKYEKGVTTVRTDAETAFELGAGVCQDYSHIFLALCRLDGIRCRYVSGLAYQNGETHAWTEINDGSSWIGIDPTNNCICGEKYIKLCHGRDYSDCPIERGLYIGSSFCTQEIYSSVEEI